MQSSQNNLAHIQSRNAERSCRRRIEMPGLDILANAPSIIVVGDHKVGKRSLVAGLPGISLDSSESVAALDIDTKYYTATARVQVHGGRHATPTPEESSGCEAVILVFDATRCASVGSLWCRVGYVPSLRPNCGI